MHCALRISYLLLAFGLPTATNRTRTTCGVHCSSLIVYRTFVHAAAAAAATCYLLPATVLRNYCTYYAQSFGAYRITYFVRLQCAV